MDEHPHVARVREYFDTFAAGDLDALGKFFSDDVVWHVAGRHPLSGDYRGREAIRRYFGTVQELSEGTLVLETRAVMTSDEHIGLFVRVTGERDGRRLDVEMAEAFTVGPDGTWTEFWAMPDDQDQVDRFWS